MNRTVHKEIMMTIDKKTTLSSCRLLVKNNQIWAGSETVAKHAVYNNGGGYQANKRYAIATGNLLSVILNSKQHIQHLSY